MIFVDLMTNSSQLMGRYPCVLLVKDIQYVLIWMEIASHNYNHKQDCYQCNISRLVMQPDTGVNEAATETVSKGKSVNWRRCNQKLLLL